MARSIEGRYPFLDYRLLEWAVSLPPDLNFHRGWNKWLLREAFGDQLPSSSRYRRDKIGFETPQAAWMTHDLRPRFLEWAAHPSERFMEVVDVQALRELVPQVVNREVHRICEKHLVLLRLYFLDRWLNVFGVR